MANSSVTNSSRSVSNINFICHTIGVHAGLLVFAYRRWPKMYSIIQQMEDEIVVPERMHRWRRWISVGCVIVILVLVQMYRNSLVMN